MHRVKNISKSTIHPESGACKPGDACEVTSTEYKLLSSNKRIEDYPPPPAAPKKKPAAKKPAASEGFL